MISLVVVTYNRLDYSKECIESILRNTDVPFELIIVDNGSADGTREWLTGLKAPQAERFTLLLNEVNLGCAVAFNQGFRLADGDPIFRIDNDVIMPDGWASAFMGLWDSDPQLGMMATDLEAEPREYPEKVGVFDPRISYFDGPVWHDHGLGSWCMAHRRAMFEQIGYYRTDFGLIVMNDTDLEKRAENAGWKLAIASGLRVGHLWQMATEDEREYNHWKIDQQAKHVETWNSIWPS